MAATMEYCQMCNISSMRRYYFKAAKNVCTSCINIHQPHGQNTTLIKIKTNICYNTIHDFHYPVIMNDFVKLISRRIKLLDEIKLRNYEFIKKFQTVKIHKILLDVDSLNHLPSEALVLIAEAVDISNDI